VGFAPGAREEFAGEGAPKVAAPDAKEEGEAKEQNDFEAGAAFAIPVGIGIKIEPEGEFIERKRGADAVEQRHQAAGQQGGVTIAGADFHEPAESHHEQDQDAPDEMMDVRAANDDVVKGAEIAASGEGSEARESHGEEKSHRGEEKAAAGTVANMLVEEGGDARMAQEKKNENGGGKDEHAEGPGIKEHRGVFSR